MSRIFDVENFNLISDNENYYFFRSLEPGDLDDIAEGRILGENGYIRLRTDRERWEENHPGQKPNYDATSQVSLEEMYSHIKMHYSLQTNCISLSSNANVARTYGETFSDRYVMIKVPKNEMGTRVFHAGQYMLEEIEKRVNDVISSVQIPDDVKQDLEDIEKAKSSSELEKIIKTRYKTKKPVDVTKARLKGGIVYRSPHARISNYQALNEEQSLEKNKVVAKLTILEYKGIMQPIIQYSKNNNFLLQTIGSAFSSSEQIYYGDIEGKRVQDIPKEIVDIFGLLQQVEGQEKDIVEELKQEVIRFVNSGKQIQSPETRKNKLRDNITIEEMYELTEGKVEYGAANHIVKNLFYLAKSQSSARELARKIKEITGNNPKYESVIKYIENNGFVIEPEITTRLSNRGFRISESVNLNIKRNELELVKKIKELSEEEQVQILENGGLSDVKGIMTSSFSNLQKEKQLSKEEYYAEAVISMYDWHSIGIDEFTSWQKSDLQSKLQEKNCVVLYQKLKAAGIEEKNIPTSILNIVLRDNLNKYVNSENYVEEIQAHIEELTKKLSIEQVEEALGYYDLEGTGIRLRDYQERAVEHIDKIFGEKQFASVVLPTGAGKTFVAITETLQHKDEAILYLAPDKQILEQTKDYIIKYVYGTKGTLGRSKDEIIAEIFPNIIFETYSGLMSKRGQSIINKKYGFILLDELHRSGAPEWEKYLDKVLENQTKETKVLRYNCNA